MTTRRFDISEEPEAGHPHAVRVDGRVHGWLATLEDAQALARIFREAGRGATISDFAGTRMPHGKATPRAAQPEPRRGTPRDGQPRVVTIVCVRGRPWEIVPASSGGRQLEAG
jgi:hypothetical protein